MSSDMYDRFWRDVLSLSSFFAPAITPLQSRLGISSREILELLGERFGRRAAERLGKEGLDTLLSKVSDMWRELKIGEFVVESRKPLKITIRNCVICGQLPEVGRLYKCAFHLGFIKGLLSQALGRDVRVEEVEGVEGEAGTWTRRFLADVES